MKTTKLLLFASIFVIAATTLGLSAVSDSTTLPTLQSQEKVGIVGYVEYTVRDSDGNIKQVLDGHNIVVQDGKDCAVAGIFNLGNCLSGEFTYIGIGNSTGAIAGDDADASLADSGITDTIGDCATNSAGGEMARVSTTTVHTAASGTDAASVTITTTEPFTFDSSNATTIYDAGLFNAGFVDTVTPDVCVNITNSNGGGTVNVDWNMFARQLVLDGSSNPLVVGDGDTLSISWTIDMG